jgi:hypothetical protein
MTPRHWLALYIHEYWSLTRFFRFLTADCGMSEEQARAAIDRSIGDAVVPYRIFYRGESKQEGSAAYWRSSIDVRLIKHNAAGKAIEPRLQVWPKGLLGWGDIRVEHINVRVPSAVVRHFYRRRVRRGSKAQQQVQEAARMLYPDGWAHREFRHMEKPIAKKMDAMGYPAAKSDVMRRALGFKK